MDVKLEKAAMKGYGLTLAEQGYYLALRTLYAAYQKGVVTKKQAAEEKKAILAAYTTEHSKEEFLDRSALALSERICKAADNFRDNQTLEAADAFYAAVFNLSENWRKEMEEEYEISGRVTGN